MDEMADMLGNRCWVCGEDYRNKWGKVRMHLSWVVHHITYSFEELKHDDFKNRREYWAYLKPQVKERGRDQFLLLCGRHHQSVERLLRFKPFTLQRLMRAVERSRLGEPYDKLDRMLDKELKRRDEQEWALRLRDVK